MKNDDGVDLPIIMYHSILKDTTRTGKYVVTPDKLASDIEYMYEKGYVSVSMSQVIDYVYNNQPLPEKPFMITFDDGSYNNYGYAAPILRKYNARGIFSIVGEYTDDYTKSNIENLNFGYMRWADVYDLYASENCEVANHSYAFHDNKTRQGSSKKRGESKEEYIKIFRTDTQKLQDEFEKNIGAVPYIYTYPFGSYSEESFEVLKDMGFKATLSCNEGINRITHDPECLYLLKRYNRPGKAGTVEFFHDIIEQEAK